MKKQLEATTLTSRGQVCQVIKATVIRYVIQVNLQPQRRETKSVKLLKLL